MKNIYIVLTQSGTDISRLIKLFTHDKYNHSSICIDEDFEKLYSFGRIYLNSPIPGGFIIENAFTHVFGKYKRVPCMILKKEITDEQYEKAVDTIQEFIDNQKKYKYDYINMVLAQTPFEVPHKNRFFCSEFVGYILQSCGIQNPSKLEKIRPIWFTKIEGAEVVYEGILEDWCKEKSAFGDIPLARTKGHVRGHPLKWLRQQVFLQEKFCESFPDSKNN